MDTLSQPAHHWRFFRIGGFDQVRLETADDIANLTQLDQKLWAALSCPVNGLEFDSRTLAMLDSDNDGRVRVQEVLSAITWLQSAFKDLSSLLAGSSELPLSTLDESQPEGKKLLASAQQLLSYLGKPDATSLTIDDVKDTDSLLKNSIFNGDGIIPVLAANDDATKKLIEEIMDCLGSDTDRSGLPGISRERLSLFCEAAQKYADWWQQAKASSDILPLGDGTPAAAAVFTPLKNKIDDYFTRCGLASFDPKAESSLNPAIATYETLATQDLATSISEVERFPLAHVQAGRALPLEEGINPAWAAMTARFAELVVKPLVGQTHQLEFGQWQQIKAAFAPFEAWQSKKIGGEVEKLGLERVQEILQSEGRANLERLIDQDLSLADQVDSISKVVRLVHFNRDLHRLLNNFVSFHDFYANGRKAIFQAGSLYIDGRACELCVKVAGADAHSPMANLSHTYLAYCNCKRRNTNEQMIIAAAFTGGDSDNLMVGRNGVFYDAKGNDWDATIVKILDHPISVSQAFWAPYKRIARMIAQQLEKFAAAKDKEVDSKAAAHITGQAKPASPEAPFDVGKFAGIFAAIGLALGAVGTAVATILGSFLALPVWQMPLALVGIVLAISGPSMLIAFLKLRQRNLGPILDANGWAVNTKASINIPFGSTLTKIAELPQGAERVLRDPFAEKETPWKRWVVALVLLILLGFAWNKGYIQDFAKNMKGGSSQQTSQPAPAPEKKADAAK